MISTDEMSSASMDIGESFRPEDLSKTDFFDFVSASEIGIGVGIRDVGVGMSLQAQHHQYQGQHHQQQSQSLERLPNNSNMTHDGGGTNGRNNNNIGDNSASNGNTGDPTIPNYEFWPSDKDSSRLDPSIFEDFDRYCWQQQQQQSSTTTMQTHNQPANQTTNTTTHNSETGSSVGVLNCDSSAASNSTSRSTTHDTNSAAGSRHLSQHNSTTNTLSTTNVHNSDGQIYTITVLNGGNEPATGAPTTPTWLKREPEETQIPTSLDLDTLLGNFSGYVKSEYPYDDSGFSTDGTKEAINNEVNGISIQQQQQEASTLPGMSNLGSNQALPPLVTAMSGGRACVSIGQQLAAQFQNNNNDWHMIDHNAEHNSAESLLRSALQGKGYTKGLHHMQNSSVALLPGSPNTKDDEMRRIFFSNDTDSLAFADSTLNTSQIFEESQHQTNLLQLHNNTPSSGIPSNGPTSHPIHTSNSSNLMIDDMFLTLENAFSDDFDKMKRIANEVQQYCNTPSVESDYISSDMMMQISPSSTAGGTTTNRLQPLHSPITTTPSSMVHIGPPSSSPLATVSATHQHQHQQQQHHKPDVTTGPKTTVNAPMTSKNPPKTTKRYKRVSNTTSNNNTTNNNNPSAINNNNSTTTKNTSSNTGTNTNITNSSNCTQSSGGSSSSSSNSPPAPHCNGQRKERSLHYCSICSKGFKDKYSVNVHIRTHTGEKPFACSLCGKSFRQKAHLAKHYQTHMAQKNNHGTSIIKGSSSKHHRTATTAVANNTIATAAAAAAVAQQRQLGMLTSSSSMSSQMTGNSGSSGGGGGSSLGLSINPNILGVTSTVVTLNGPVNSTNLTTNVLTPPNSLLANR